MARWRWRLFALGAGTVFVGTVVGLVWPILAGRTDPPFYGKRSAQSVLEDARRAASYRWAPDAMREAEAAMKAALFACRREEVRLLPFRDYRAARAAIAIAEAKALRALSEGTRNRLEAKMRADEALGEATRDNGRSSNVAAAMNLAGYNRTLLQKSKIALAEARAMYDRGDYVEAASRAKESGSQSRTVSQKAVAAAARYADASLVERWRRMIRETVAWSRSTRNPAIVVLKENHRVDLYDDGRVVKSYRADMGYRSVNDKMRSGDAATPEGRYHITEKRPAATYYRALALNYPNAEDRADFERLKRQGRVPRGASPGGLIQIHGDGGRGKDWTRGCVALSNRDMDDLYRRVGVGTPVTIVGGDGQGVFARLVRDHAATTGSELQ